MKKYFRVKIIKAIEKKREGLQYMGKPDILREKYVEKSYEMKNHAKCSTVASKKEKKKKLRQNEKRKYD